MRIIFFKQTIQICLLIFFLAFASACKENKFPVSPLTDSFEFIPPNDVNLLVTEVGDQKVTLTWGESLDTNLKAVHVTNLNDNKTEVLPGNANEATFTGLTNLEKYTFLVKTENNKDLLSYGVTISAKPFLPDNISPGPVTGVRGFKLGEKAVLALWENPDDADLDKVELSLGKESVVVSGEQNFATIRGNVDDVLIIRTIDLSGNYSIPVEALADNNLIEISATDNGTTETLRLYKDPAITVVDQYIISYFGEETKVSGPLPEIHEHTINMNNGRGLWIDGDNQRPSWLEPVNIRLLFEGEEVASYSYQIHNHIPGTVFATHFTDKSEDIKRENEGNSFNSNIGFLAAGLYCEYDVEVLEEGMYTIIAHGSRPDSDIGRYEIVFDGISLGEGEIIGNNDWGSHNPHTGPDVYLEKGKHKMRLNILTGGNNYRKFVFVKK